jgi:alkanesulfonate monooxygenase SsuD/methylene tetrahydromethanopterin reductase-like flavin-dependent oxidoreductase (luciferase family)
MTPNATVLAAAASQRTKNARIAVLGPLLPLANPVRVAEEIAMLDSINGGRTVVLFLRGIANEHRTYTPDGEAPPNTRELTQEAAQLVLKAWTEPQSFSWHSEHFHFQHVSVWPRPLQEPHPPVFYSGNSEESIAFAAKHRMNLAIGFAPLPVVAKHIAMYREQAAAAGWTPGPDSVLYRARLLVTDDDEQAQAIVQRMAPRSPSTGAPLGGAGGGNPGAGGFQFFGTPDTIVGQVRGFHEAGVGILDVAFSGVAYGRGGTKKAMERFADALREIQGMAATVVGAGT